MGIEATIQDAAADKLSAIPTTDTTDGTKLVYPTFHYSAYSTLGAPITVHYCRDLASFTDAVEHLKGEKYLGIDIEYEPESRSAQQDDEDNKKSDAAQQLDQEIGDIGVRELYKYLAIHPDSGAKLMKSQSHPPSGILLPDSTYFRLTGYSKTKVSVLQISSPKHIVVAHLAAFPYTNEIFDKAEFVPVALQTILVDPNVVKMGVEIATSSGDMYRCSRYLDSPSKGLLDLHEVDALIRFKAGEKYKKAGLKGLCEIYLGQTLVGKGAGSTTTSEWQLPTPLSSEQVYYAANDAFVAIKLHEAMMQRLVQMDPIPALPALRHEPQFIFKEWHARRVAECKARNTASAKRALKALLGFKTPPPQPVVLPNGMSKGAFNSMNARMSMTSLQYDLAINLTRVRNKLLWEDYGIRNDPKQNWRVMEDKIIDRLAIAYPRPTNKDEMLEHLNSATKNRIYDEDVTKFFSIIQDHVSSYPEDAIVPAKDAVEKGVQSNGEVQAVAPTDGGAQPPEDKGTLVMVEVKECLESILQN